MVSSEITSFFSLSCPTIILKLRQLVLLLLLLLRLLNLAPKVGHDLYPARLCMLQVNCLLVDRFVQLVWLSPSLPSIIKLLTNIQK